MSDSGFPDFMPEEWPEREEEEFIDNEPGNPLMNWPPSRGPVDPNRPTIRYIPGAITREVYDPEDVPEYEGDPVDTPHCHISGTYHFMYPVVHVVSLNLGQAHELLTVEKVEDENVRNEMIDRVMNDPQMFLNFPDAMGIMGEYLPENVKTRWDGQQWLVRTSDSKPWQTINDFLRNELDEDEYEMIMEEIFSDVMGSEDEDDYEDAEGEDFDLGHDYDDDPDMGEFDMFEDEEDEPDWVSQIKGHYRKEIPGRKTLACGDRFYDCREREQAVLTVDLTYPFEKVIRLTIPPMKIMGVYPDGEEFSREDISPGYLFWVIGKEIQRIYRDSPDIVWGHGIGDLALEGMRIFPNGYVHFFIGS